MVETLFVWIRLLCGRNHVGGLQRTYRRHFETFLFGHKTLCYIPSNLLCLRGKTTTTWSSRKRAIPGWIVVERDIVHHLCRIRLDWICGWMAGNESSIIFSGWLHLNAGLIQSCRDESVPILLFSRYTHWTRDMKIHVHGWRLQSPYRYPSTHNRDSFVRGIVGANWIHRRRRSRRKWLCYHLYYYEHVNLNGIGLDNNTLYCHRLPCSLNICRRIMSRVEEWIAHLS